MEEIKELEIGEYVRTENGFIGKVVNENIDAYLLDKRIRPYGAAIRDYCIFKDEINSYGIVKHSKNIIDLIEIGDYVNRNKVSNVDKIMTRLGLERQIEWENGDFINTVENYGIIKSIVTKEQFASLEYKI